MKGHDREGGVDLALLFNPGHITGLKGKGHMRRTFIPGNVVEKEPLRPNCVLGINAPPPVGNNGGIHRSHHSAPGAGAHPQLSLCIPASRRDIHPVLSRLLEYHTVARRLKIPKAVRPSSDDPLLELAEVRVGNVLKADLDLGGHWRGDDEAGIEAIADLKVRTG